jgi:ubiquinone/menaquinone biosynthesis C-methylase UbiE
MAAAMGGETEQMRSERRRRRALFDGVAELYQASRRGYPAEIIGFVTETASLNPGSAVLEVGCGTGQLTGQLAANGFAVTAIDLGGSMVAAARRRLGASRISFDVVSFEELEAPEGTFDLIISATAFHWIDPEVKFTKSARLLRAGGWLALATTGERYDDPFGTTLHGMWAARNDDGGTWAKLPDIDIAGSTGLFASPVRRSVSRRIVLPAEVVIGVESTRATFLSWPADIRRGFLDELRSHLGPGTQVQLTQESSVTMARALPRS